MEVEEFVWESSSLPFIFAPPFFISVTVVFVCTWIVSPLLAIICVKVVPRFNILRPKDKSVFKTLIASTLHAIVLVFLSSYILINGLMGSNRLFSKSPLGFVSMQITLGYFVGDFIVILLDPHLRKNPGYVFHHIAAIIGVSLGLYNQGKGMFFIVYRMLAEVSTPFVNGSQVIKMTKNTGSKWFLRFSWPMIITFFVFRIAVIPWHWYEILISVLFNPAAVPHLVPTVYKYLLCINYLAFDLLNIWWFGKMVRIAINFFS